MIADNTPVKHSFKPSDVKTVGDNHFRLDMGLGFGLDIVLLYSFSLAFRSYGGNLLDLQVTDKWPGSLFNPVVGKA